MTSLNDYAQVGQRAAVQEDRRDEPLNTTEQEASNTESIFRSRSRTSSEDGALRHGTDNSWGQNEYPRLDLNLDALKHVADFYIPGRHGRCTNVVALTRGTYHEIKVLEFEDRWSCIARFTRNKELLDKAESELATTEHARKHTNIPVPQLYFVNFNEHHAVGAPFVLMERMPGVHLYQIWDELSTEQKKGVIAQIADVIAQLVSLKFQQIGSLKSTGVGPLHDMAWGEIAPGQGPFNTTRDYFHNYLNAHRYPGNEDMEAMLEDIKDEMDQYLEYPSSTLEPPFRLIHGDFDAQNMLFTHDDESGSPKLSAVIDWDYSYTGPLYYLCDYPIFIRDVDSMYERHLWPENKLLRKHLVTELITRFPRGSQDREDVRACFRQKCYALNGFKNIFTGKVWDDKKDPGLSSRMFNSFLEDLQDGGEPAYGGRLDWEPDTEPDSSDDEDESDFGEALDEDFGDMSLL